MLNRVFIFIGVLAILALAAAFVVPRFIQWSDYRERMEVLAAGALGTEVHINGDIGFTLLPAPQLHFSDVVVGPLESPVLMVKTVDADFSLMDFLRDRYSVTRLVINQPVFDFTIDENGLFTTPLKLAEKATSSNISIANASVIDGSLGLYDVRSDRRMTTTGINGELRLNALRGPFVFSGSSTVDGQRYDVRISTSAMDAEGMTQLSAFAKPVTQAFSYTLEGMLHTGATPKFNGTMQYRQAPVAAQNADNVQGDLVLDGKIEASPERIVLSNAVLQPDENRAGTRLQGSAVIELGAAPKFDAAISGGVVALPARDARQDQAAQPYEIVRLLKELPIAPVPSLPGTIGIDIAELNLRAFALRNVRIDAVSTGESWVINKLTGRLPGDSELQLTGKLGTDGSKPSFDGSLSISTERMDALAGLWRKGTASTPLLNMPASLDTKVSLTGDTLGFSNGSFVLDGAAHAVSAEVGFGDSRSLQFRGKFNALSPDDSAALVALLPDTADPAFSLSFPKGRFSVDVDMATLFELPARKFSANGSWSDAGVEFTRLAAADLGGGTFDLSAKITGTASEPQISATGAVGIKTDDALALTALFDMLKVPEATRTFIARSMPLQVDVQLDAPKPEGGQLLTVNGRAGVANLSFTAQLAGGVAKALTSPLSLQATIISDDPNALNAQLGLGGNSLLPSSAPVKLSVGVEGSAANSLETTIVAEGNGDSISFDGSLIVSDPETLKGSGLVKIKLSDAAALADIVGASGIYVPPLSASANLGFSGLDSMTLTNINGTAGSAPFSGDMSLNAGADSRGISGMLSLPPLDVGALASVSSGASALMVLEGGVWPDGPFSIGDEPRRTEGRLHIETPSINAGAKPLVSDASFDLVWDATNIRLRGLQGSIGGGRIDMDVGVCCSGPIAEKRLFGRVTLDGVALDAVLPQGPAGNLAGTVSGSVQFDGSGESIAGAMAGMTGEGSFSLTDLTIEKLNPKAFVTVAGLDNILEQQPDDLTNIVAVALDQGAFTAPEMSGVFNIAGGIVRVANLAAEGVGARLFGGGSLTLKDLGLAGSFTLTPVGVVDPKGLINEATSLVTAVISGTLFEPVRELDLGTMVDSIKVRAYEIEVDRLEQLRAQDEARAKAAAEERARLMEEQAKRVAAEEAAKAAAVEEKRLADEALKRKAEDAAAAAAAARQIVVPPPPPPISAPVQTQPFDLGLPPPPPR